MYLQRQSYESKRSAWHFTFGCWIISGILLVILMVIGFPDNLWDPFGFGNLFRGFLTSSLFISLGLSFVGGPCTSLEDFDVRTHTGQGTITNPLSNAVGGVAGLLGLGGIVLIIRYLWIIFSEWHTLIYMWKNGI